MSLPVTRACGNTSDLSSIFSPRTRAVFQFGSLIRTVIDCAFLFIAARTAATARPRKLPKLTTVSVPMALRTRIWRELASWASTSTSGFQGSEAPSGAIREALASAADFQISRSTRSFGTSSSSKVSSAVVSCRRHRSSDTAGNTP